MSVFPGWRLNHRPSLQTIAALFLLLVCLSLVALDGWRTYIGRLDAIADANVKTTNITRSVAQQAEDLCDSADVLLFGIVERLETDGLGPAQLDRLHRFLVARIGEQPRFRGVFIYDEKGDWLVNSLPGTPPGMNNADRDYFKFHKNNPSRATHIGDPVRSRFGHQWVITITRRFDHPDGSFAGVVLVSIDMDYIQKFYDTFNIGKNGAILLARADGTVLVRRPFVEANVGRNISSGIIFHDYLPKAPAGTAEMKSSIDGVSRLQSYQTLAPYPLVVAVAIETDEALAPWRERALSQLAAGVALAVVIGLFGFWLVRQIKRRQTAERSAAQAAAEYRLMADHSTDIIFRLGLDFVRHYVSPAARQILGFEPAELIGTTSFIKIHPEDVEKAAKAYRQVANGATERAEARFRTAHRDGSWVWVEVKLGLVRDPVTGRPAEIISSMRDISSRKATQDALTRARDAADAASRAKSEFLANMSHEIRTPMNGIIGMNDLLLKSPLGAVQRRYALAVRSSADSLLSVINDILDISKLEAGKVELEALDFNLSRVIEDAVELMAPRANEKRLELVADFFPGDHTWLRGDPTRIRQIVLNLLSNAIKFTEQGFVVVAAKVGPSLDGSTEVAIVVEDSGIGMSDAAKAKLFQKFEQADGSITRRFGGTGLGLAISKQLVELMGGTITVADRPGGGTSFRLTLALAPALEPEVAEELPLAALAGLRALVVDDFALSRTNLVRQLASLGLRAAEVPNGLAALAELGQAERAGNPFDLVLIDQAMPEMDGSALADMIGERGLARRPTLILVAPVGPSAVKGEVASSLIDAILPKPAKLQQLAACILGANDSRAAAETALSARAVGNAHAVRSRILVAEDNAINQQIAHALLADLGHEVEIVADGRQAVEAVRRQHYDLVLMDVQMPVLDGLNATREIRLLEGEVGQLPIIAMTANAMKGDREACLEAGMNDYVSKPFEAAQFARTVERWLGLSRLAGDEAAADQLLDRQHLQALAKMMPAGRINLVLQTYLEGDLARRQSIESLAATAELGELAQEAHDLKSMCGNIGARRLQAVAEDLEAGCRRLDLAHARTAAARLPAIAYETATALRAHLSALKPNFAAKEIL